MRLIAGGCNKKMQKPSFFFIRQLPVQVLDGKYDINNLFAQDFMNRQIFFEIPRSAGEPRHACSAAGIARLLTAYCPLPLSAATRSRLTTSPVTSRSEA